MSVKVKEAPKAINCYKASKLPSEAATISGVRPFISFKFTLTPTYARAAIVCGSFLYAA